MLGHVREMREKRTKSVVAVAMLLLAAAALVKVTWSGPKPSTKLSVEMGSRARQVSKDALDISQYSWEAASSASCKSVCAGKNLEAVSSGINRNSKELYYVCRALVPGFNDHRVGMNEASHLGGVQCLLGGSKFFTNFECMCQPKGALSTWIPNEGIFKSCQTTCLRNGLSAVPSGKYFGVSANPSLNICSVCWQSGGWGCRPGYNVMAINTATCDVYAGSPTISEVMNCLCVNSQSAACQV